MQPSSARNGGTYNNDYTQYSSNDGGAEVQSSSRVPSYSSPSSALAFERRQIVPALQRREQVGSLRRLRPFHQDGSMDFSSNDYLGLAQNPQQQEKVERTCRTLQQESRQHNALLLGSTGSRLLTGDSEYAQTLEERLAKWHKRPAALLCNSGYDANLSVLSCLTFHTVVLMDVLSHNSLQMGVRLSKDCVVETFLHNDVEDLRRLLQRYSSSTPAKPILVVAESVYSMDGDLAPLQEILDVSLKYNASAIVDEAHGLGVFGSHGMGVLERDGLENHPALLLSIHTFGKAAGCHGAVICGSQAIKEYLLNYGRPIIYSTSMPMHSLVTIACSYQSMAGPLGESLRTMVQERIQFFRQGMSRTMDLVAASSSSSSSSSTKMIIGLVDSISPIQALIIPGNTACVEFCERLWERSKSRIRLYPIRSPTVPMGQERVRIIVHAHNTPSEISTLLSLLKRTLQDMGYLQNLQSKL